MDTLLLVEDEKMIRRGIRAICERSGVEIRQIIEARNGEEALAVLGSQPVDMMITDIRMPKMDGIALVKSAREQSLLPPTIVVSGYDDFSYAVELLRSGVRDYILKPIEREKLTATLREIDGELREKSLPTSGDLRDLLRNGGEIARACVLLCAGRLPQALPPGCITADIDGQYAICCLPESADEAWTLLRGQSPGRSAPSCSPRKSWQEAVAARLCAYLCVVNIPGGAQPLPGDIGERHARALSGNMEPIAAQWREIAAKVRTGKASVQSFIATAEDLLGRVQSDYGDIIHLDSGQTAALRNPLCYDSLDAFLADLLAFLGDVNEALRGQMGEHLNRAKIERARAYIDLHFDKEISMAEISNMLSMNYSLFSAAFKLYTGENFSAYVKRLRIEKAKALLRDTDMMVIEIGRAVGYESNKHFLKVFKAACALSPGEYRIYARLHDRG